MPHNGNLAHFLDLRLDFGKEVDELDVSGQEELSGVETAQVELGVQQLELHDRTATRLLAKDLLQLRVTRTVVLKDCTNLDLSSPAMRLPNSPRM